MDTGKKPEHRRYDLNGCRILITRPREQSQELCDQIEALGGETIIFPTIRIVDPASFAPLDEAIRAIDTFDWIVFTSSNGVKRFFQRMAVVAPRCDRRIFQHIRMAAIGPKTAAVIEQHGLTVDLIPDEYRAEALLSALKERVSRNDRLLLPRADIARKVLSDGLREAGCQVSDVDAYRIVRDTDKYEQMINCISQGRIDIITFTSPSTVKNFVKALNDTGKPWYGLLNNVRIACIGPVTADSVRQLIREPDIVAENYTIDGLLSAIIESGACIPSKKSEREGNVS